ncbi:hypothetical protein Pve01_48760 [Planomonospora venezuelensis]|nr:hypothetical protein Pve01_48760 [Planomonospora venezuelensis]
MGRKAILGSSIQLRVPRGWIAAFRPDRPHLRLRPPAADRLRSHRSRNDQEIFHRGGATEVSDLRVEPEAEAMSSAMRSFPNKPGPGGPVRRQGRP